ncbi:hypothetical protein LEP1GSC052_2678 [Leptospira kmetyi serovar Malaysia str. Bejo-Iso9]|nr:hypothetical protein LEP1GSC052_2678 [Leptospira kmetyi serovar Malaysia str. Bejo-Iso9]
MAKAAITIFPRISNQSSFDIYCILKFECIVFVRDRISDALERRRLEHSDQYLIRARTV